MLPPVEIIPLYTKTKERSLYNKLLPPLILFSEKKKKGQIKDLIYNSHDLKLLTRQFRLKVSQTTFKTKKKNQLLREYILAA